MTRQEKYRDTTTFKFYNANPKGRITGDCVIRAISTATGKNYWQVLDDLYVLNKATGYILNEKQCYDKYLEMTGWKKQKQPRKSNNTKYTGEEFCRFIQERLAAGDKRYQSIIAHVGGHHIVAIINGRIHDIWNSTGGCIGNYWM